MNHERFEDLKDAFVLGALPESERREFEEYLIEHPERQAEIDDLSTVAGLLALSPDEQEPPPELRRSIMDLVEAEAGRPRVESWSWLARMQEFLGVRGLALGAAAMLVIGLFSWNMILQSEIRDMQGQIQSRQSAQDSQTVALEGSGAARGAQAELVVLEGDQAVLVAEDMPPPPEGKTFQIWVIESDVPKPSGLFEPADKDRVAAVVEKPLEGADAVAVTVEPEGGSAKPTTEPMLTAKL